MPFVREQSGGTVSARRITLRMDYIYSGSSINVFSTPIGMFTDAGYNFLKITHSNATIDGFTIAGSNKSTGVKYDLRSYDSSKLIQVWFHGSECQVYLDFTPT